MTLRRSPPLSDLSVMNLPNEARAGLDNLYGSSQFLTFDSVYFLSGCYSKSSELGHRVAQSVKRLTLGFGSGHDLTVMRPSPSRQHAEWAWRLLGILSLPLSLCPCPSQMPSLNKQTNKQTNIHLKKFSKLIQPKSLKCDIWTSASGNEIMIVTHRKTGSTGQ